MWIELRTVRSFHLVVMGLVTVSDVCIRVCIANSFSSKFPVDVSLIVISNTSLVFGTQTNRLFGFKSHGSSQMTLRIADEAMTTKLNCRFLQIGNLSFLKITSSGLCTSSVGAAAVLWCFGNDLTGLWSFIASVSNPDNISIHRLNHSFSDVVPKLNDSIFLNFHKLEISLITLVSL
jgi:hypothetical protein